jgi:hypothetical protein
MNIPSSTAAMQLPAPAQNRAPAAPAAPTTTLHLSVVSARQWIPSGLAQGQAIPHYRWLIVIDDTGDPSHYGTSLPMGPGNSNFDCTPSATVTCKVDGFKIDGSWFSMPLANPGAIASPPPGT